MGQQLGGFGRRNANAVAQPMHREAPRTPKVHALHGGGLLPSRADTVAPGAIGGNALPIEISYPASTHAASEVEMMRFIGANWPKYRDLWLAMRNDGGPRIGWSWAALLLGNFWLLYRKQYAIAFSLFAINIALAFTGFDGFGTLLSLAVCGVLGVMGKSIVVMRGMSTIAHIKALQLPADVETRRIEKAGGTSFAGPVILILLIFFGAVLLAGLNQAAKASKGKERTRAGQEQSMLLERDR